MNTLRIFVCPMSPDVHLDMDLESVERIAHEDLLDCCASGDAEPACRHVLDTYAIDWVSWDMDMREMVSASDSTLQDAARGIYSDSESDFDDIDTARLYLIWEVAHSYKEDLEREEQ